MVQDILEGYSRWLDLSKSKNTKNAYISSIKSFIREVGRDIDRISEIDITDYLYRLRERCSERSLARHAYALKSFLEFAGKTELSLKIPIPSAWTSSEPKWLEYDKIKMIIENASSIRDKAIIQTAYDLALRVGEVCLLNRHWLDIKSKTMKVLRLKRRGQREFILPIEDETVDLLRKYLESRSDNNQALFISLSSRGVQRISHDSVNYAFKKACERAGLKNISFHVLRHSRLTHMALNGVDIVSIAKYAGHTNLNSSLVYIHLASEHLRRKVEAYA